MIFLLTMFFSVKSMLNHDIITKHMIITLYGSFTDR